MKSQYNKAMILASGSYLSEPFPSDWETMDDEQLGAFMEDNNWEPFSGTAAGEVFSFIETLAYEFIRVAKDGI